MMIMTMVIKCIEIMENWEGDEVANEIDDKVEIAEAYYGIGTGYLGLNQYDEAIRYLEYGKRIKMVLSHSPAIGIDTPQDLEEARTILEKQQP